MRVLYFGHAVLKDYPKAAPDQELILRVFEELGWPWRIDDPLPRNGRRNPKQRLHDAIKRLNRRHLARGIRFRGDGSGTGVIWEAT